MDSVLVLCSVWMVEKSLTPDVVEGLLTAEDQLVVDVDVVEYRAIGGDWGDVCFCWWRWLPLRLDDADAAVGRDEEGAGAAAELSELVRGVSGSSQGGRAR